MMILAFECELFAVASPLLDLVTYIFVDWRCTKSCPRYERMKYSFTLTLARAVFEAIRALYICRESDRDWKYPVSIINNRTFL